MLPDDWADGSLGPRWFELPDEWGQLEARYARLGPSPAMLALVDVVRRHGVHRVLLEREYIDADYRDEYGHFYAGTFRPLPDRCERLHFFARRGGRPYYVGFSVIRPIAGRPICRTVVAPPPSLRSHVSCLAPARATPFGFAHRAYGFPFMEQDYQFGVCAHAAIWAISLYHHLAHQQARHYLSSIVAAASVEDIGRPTPSTGLSARQIVAAFQALGLPPLFYLVNRLPPGETAESVVCRYLNSRLPVLLLTPGHATVLIGYGKAAGRFFFVRNDDARGPYRVTNPLAPIDDLGPWMGLMVPFPGRIYLPGESAEEAADFHFTETLFNRSAQADLKALWASRALRLRTYVVRAADYKRRLRGRTEWADVADHHGVTSTSQWIWVVELQLRAAAEHGRACVLGEMAIDATSDPLYPRPLFCNLPGELFRWPALHGEITVTDSSQAAHQPYRSGAALHVA